MNLTAQLIGVIALSITVSSFQINNRRKLILLQMLSTSIWSIHYVLIGALTGGAIALINVFRNVVFYNRNVKKWASSKIWFYVYIIACVSIMIITWKGYVSILATLGTLIYATMLWQDNVKYIRIGGIMASVLWITYNILIGSYPGIASESIIIISNLIAILRFDVKEHKKYHYIAR